MGCLIALPTELIIEVLSYLDYESLHLGVQCVSRRLKCIVEETPPQVFKKCQFLQNYSNACGRERDNSNGSKAYATLDTSGDTFEFLALHPCIKRLRYSTNGKGEVKHVGFYNRARGWLLPLSHSSFSHLGGENAFSLIERNTSIDDLEELRKGPHAFISGLGINDIQKFWALSASVADFVTSMTHHIGEEYYFRGSEIKSAFWQYRYLLDYRTSSHTIAGRSSSCYGTSSFPDSFLLSGPILSLSPDADDKFKILDYVFVMLKGAGPGGFP